MVDFVVPNFRKEQDIVHSLKLYSEDLKDFGLYFDPKNTILQEKILEILNKITQLVDLMNDKATIEMMEYKKIIIDDNARFIL